MDLKAAAVYNDSVRRSLRHLRYHIRMAPWGKRMFCRCFNTMKARMIDSEAPEVESTSSRALRAVGWTSVAVGITALGLFVGRELRVRYKFKRRTPSDFYSHAGEDLGVEYGMGI
jgi:hypothetical protein